VSSGTATGPVDPGAPRHRLVCSVLVAKDNTGGVETQDLHGASGPGDADFGTEATRSELMSIYDERMRHWPVPYEASFVRTRFGSTHVVVSGDPTSPPLVLLHPMGAGSQVWSSIISALSERHRCYALDTIGDVGKSELDDPDRYPITWSCSPRWGSHRSSPQSVCWIR
jgi:hypothetical protein